MNTKKLTIVRVQTSTWEEEDFMLLTSLTQDQIIEVISEMVKQEREENEFYENSEYESVLKNTYPNEIIELFTYDSIDTITF